MAILFTVADGSEQHYDTIEEFEKAMILMKRLNGEKVPQDLLDEVRDKYGGKDLKTIRVEIDGSQVLEDVGKLVEEFSKGIDDTEEGVNMENLPIGTLVKVVGNWAVHCHDAGEILPITEIDEGDAPYLLDGRTAGWVAVEDIEFVSFPEEEESTSGDEDEEESELEFKVGDKVRVKGADYHSLEGGDIGTVTDIAESIRHTHNGRLIPTPYEVTINNNLEQFVAPEHLELIEEVESEDSEIKAGDTVIATEDEFGIRKGSEYEIREDVDGDRYFLDDDGDIRFVINRKEILRKKIIEAIDEPKFEVGGILRCNKGSVYVTEGKLYEVLAIDRDGDAVYMDDGNSVSFVNETDIPERFEIL